jgi:hypothetical protein
MAVEIRELVIRAVAVAAERDASEPPAREADGDRQALIQECVRQVLRILQQQKGR